MRTLVVTTTLLLSGSVFAFCGPCGAYCNVTFDSQDDIVNTFTHQAQQDGKLGNEFKDVTFRYKDVDGNDVVTGSGNYSQHEKVTADLKNAINQLYLVESYPFRQYCMEQADRSIFFLFDSFSVLNDEYDLRYCLQEVWRVDTGKDTCTHIIEGFKPIITPQLDPGSAGLEDETYEDD